MPSLYRHHTRPLTTMITTMTSFIYSTVSTTCKQASSAAATANNNNIDIVDIDGGGCDPELGVVSPSPPPHLPCSSSSMILPMSINSPFCKVASANNGHQGQQQQHTHFSHHSQQQYSSSLPLASANTGYGQSSQHHHHHPTSLHQYASAATPHKNVSSYSGNVPTYWLYSLTPQGTPSASGQVAENNNNLMHNASQHVHAHHHQQQQPQQSHLNPYKLFGKSHGPGSFRV